MVVIRTLNRKAVVHTLGVAGLGLGLLTSVVGAPSAMAQETASQGVDRQLLQDESDLANLSDEELKQLLIKLLQERSGEKESVPALPGDEGGKDVVIARFQDGQDGVDPAAFEEKHVEIYNEFTQALADELGIDNSDDVDAAIRIAMMSVIDSHVDDGMLTKGKAEALKALVATADVPIAPGFAFGPHPGAFFIAGHGPGFGPGVGPMMPGREGMRQWIVERRDSARGDEGESHQWANNDESKERGARAEKGAKGEKDSQSDDSQVDEEKQG
jgi:hypothetical protein